ncbi:MAG TPA: hypothetical protein DGZ24_06590 [Rhodospirillaceae bacterium]|nr:hypothetical protein [Rhodospirillaceae bacterium]
MLATRRRLLRGMMGGTAVSVGLPFLNCFLDESGTVLAATGQKLPTCFGTWFWGCGLNPGRWEPNTLGSDYDLPPEVTALAPIKNKVNVLSGFKVFTDGKAQQPHHTGNLGILTGHVSKTAGQDVHPSVDNLIADVVGTKTRFKSIEATATGNARHTQSYRGGSVVNPAEVSPAALYARIFGPEFQDPNAADFTPDPKVMARRSVLSGVNEQRKDFEKNLGEEDKIRLDEYFTSLRQFEQQLDFQLQKPPPTEACTMPQAPGETPYSLDIEEATTNHELFAGLFAHALACNQTRVFNMVFTDEQSTVRRPGTTTTHHILTHEEAVDEALGYQPLATWFCNRIVEQFAYMVKALDGIREGDGTLLDRSLLFGMSETGFAKVHSLENIPMFTAGSGGGRVRTGIHVSAKGDPGSRVGLTMQQAMGVPVTTWGTDSLRTSKAVSEILI